MTKVVPERDMTRSARNYFAHGGGELVIGGKLTFLPGATVEGGDDLFGQSEPAAQIAYIADSEATTIAGGFQRSAGRPPQRGPNGLWSMR